MLAATMAYPQTISALADLAATDGHLHVICKAPRCTHDAKLWPRALIAKYGADLPVETIRKHLKCAACGAAGPAMNVMRGR